MQRIGANVSVRVAHPQEADVLAEIKRTVEDETYSSYGTPEEHQRGLLEFCSPAYVTKLMNEPETVVLVAEIEGRQVGLGAITNGARCSKIHAIYSTLRGRGVGLSLVLEAAERATRTDVCCEIFDRNVYAIDFFSELGFTPYGERQSDTYRARTLEKFHGARAAVIAKSASRLGRAGGGPSSRR